MAVLKSLLTFVFFLFATTAKSFELSDSARISLLTVAPGEELYSAFGHSGIRVTDYKQDFDVVFNYGTFDFNQPDFYLNFVKGRLLYMVDVESYRNFMNMYVYEQRAVVEDELNLTTEEKQKIFAFLDNNVKPENRDYRYEFFFDNCASRIRDVFEKELGKKLNFDYASFDTTITLRQMLDIYVNNSPWVKFGFYLILGLPCDVKATPRVQVFLPDYLQKAFQSASVESSNGTQPFVTSTKVLLNYPRPLVHDQTFTPKFVMLLVLFIGGLITLLEYSVKKQFLIVDILLFGLAGLLGCFFLFMWFFTEHYSVEKNLNLLWAIPFHLPIAFLLMFKSARKYFSTYFLFVFGWMLLLLPLKLLLPQPIHLAVFPMIILLALRAWRLQRFLKKEGRSHGA